MENRGSVRVPGSERGRVGGCPSRGTAASCGGGRPTPGLPMSPASRLSPKHRDDRRKTGSQRSSGSRSPSPSGGSGWGSPQQNGGSRQRSGAQGCRPGSAHSLPDVRTPHFAEGSRAARAAPCWGRAGCCRAGGSECVTGRGRCTPAPGPPLPPPMRPPRTGAARNAWLLRPPGPSVRVRGPPPQAWATLELGKLKAREG